MMFGFNKSVNSILNLIVAYKQKLQNTNERAASSISLSQPGVMSQAKNMAFMSNSQSLDSIQNLDNSNNILKIFVKFCIKKRGKNLEKANNLFF